MFTYFFITNLDIAFLYTLLGDLMKEYYVFSLKKEFAYLYRDKQSELFYIFNRIYYMKEIDKEYGYNLFEQISNFFNKKEVNSFIRDRYQNSMMYSGDNGDHIINNLFLGEVSIMKIKSSYIKIESNILNPVFFNDLKDYADNLFVCSFKDNDYFFLTKRKIKIKS